MWTCQQHVPVMEVPILADTAGTFTWTRHPMSMQTTHPFPAHNDALDVKPPPDTTSILLSNGKILEQEFTALTSCLKDAVVKTGQIYSFYADTRRLNIQKYITNPPRTLTKALGRDIEKYDQLCDSIEAHLHRAINTLKRDLRREQAKADAEARRKNLEALMLPPSLPVSSEPSSETPVAQSASDGNTTSRNSPVSTIGRRPSAISISSLQRPQLPLKLDLSTTSLRITEEEAALYSKGLASPVTLAPKSARPLGPSEFPPDLIAAFASNSSVPLDSNGHPNMNFPPSTELLGLSVGIGDSSDKPIELDLDVMDMDMSNMPGPFSNSTEAGEASNSNGNLLSSMMGDATQQRLEGDNTTTHSQQAEESNTNSFQLDATATDELFGNLTPNAEMGVDFEHSASSMLQPQSTSAPSPGSLLAHLSDPSKVSTDNTNDTEASFDINTLDLTMDMSNLSSEFFSNSSGSDVQFMSMDMQAFLESQTSLNMDSVANEKGSSEDAKA